MNILQNLTMYYKSIEGSGMPDATHSTDDKEKQRPA